MRITANIVYNMLSRSMMLSSVTMTMVFPLSTDSQDSEKLKEEKRKTYIGETSRNVYTRSLEHSGKYDKNNSDSFILKHQNEYHNGEPANVKVKFVKSFKDAMSRQISEAVTIFKTQEEGKILMNSKSEWRQASMVEMREQVVTRAVGS